jgi:SAM-dependent methyltransferase
MTYSLPFKPTDKVLEVGGGDKPMYPGHWTNIDCRPLPSVDIVADLNERWPIDDESFDGIIGNYIIEHISWRKVKDFVENSHRVLRPGGYAVFVTANLLEQCKLAIKWFEEGKGWEISQCIFGDQNYEGGAWDANAHHCGFSPAYAIKLFREAGFHEIKVFEHPACKSDMIIQAKKSGVRITRSL